MPANNDDSVTVSRDWVTYPGYEGGEVFGADVAQVVTVDWVSDSGDGTVDAAIDLYGYVRRVVMNPGDPAPLDNYDIQLADPASGSIGTSAVDALNNALLNRDTANTEQVYPSITSSGGNTDMPIFLSGSYGLQIRSAGNGTVGQVIFYLTT